MQHNEKRKLLLWLDLFANSKSSDQYSTSNAEFQSSPSRLSVGTPEVIVSKDGIEQKTEKAPLDVEKIMRTALDAVQSSAQSAAQLPADEAARIASQVMNTVDGLYNLTLEQRRKPQSDTLETQDVQPYKQSSRERKTTPSPRLGDTQSWSCHFSSLPELPSYHLDSLNQNTKPEDFRAIRTPESAAITLQSAKDQLMARLQDSVASPGVDEPLYPTLDSSEAVEDERVDSAANGSMADDIEDDDGDYHSPGDQERGLLTDIPLVLSPQEIEALPLIIQIGIVNGPTSDSRLVNSGAGDMQGVRCNILLAQEAGRNLLRELLIFIAAWDLQDNELYFKVMMQIMDAILQNGLMPFAYQALVR